MKQMEPLIILGMHRSGTSLIAQLLNDSGVFMGNNINNHFESIEFLKINQLLLNLAHANWDFPNSFEFLLNHRIKKEKTIEFVRKQVNSLKFKINFFGPKFIFANNKRKYWGWKDPRTTITFPIWKEIYPNAKFLIIYRNGVDVANSLYYREKKREDLIGKDYHSVRCLYYREAFRLWEEYNIFLKKYLKSINSRKIYELKYETFLGSPEEQLSCILENFLQIQKSYNFSKRIKEIKSENAFKFLNSKESIQFYEKIKKNKLMIELGYDCII